jgi:NTE family protein
LGVNSINVDFSDVTNQVYFQSLFVQKFLSEEGWYKFLKIKSGTLANNPVIDKSDYLSLLPT